MIAQCDKLGRGIRPEHALARVEERPLGVREHFGRLLDPRRTALIAVDLQNYFTRGVGLSGLKRG